MARLVSVILPCFNAAPWLDAALASILGQSHRELELLTIDDGSTDSTPEILARAAKRDSRMRLIRKEANAGIVTALNTGLDQSQGDYVARMDADDIAAPQRFTHQLAFLDESGVDLCGSWVKEFGHGVPRVVRWPHTETALRTSMLFQNSICHPTFMAKRHVFAELRYRTEYLLAEDYELCTRAYQRFRLANVPEILLRYRRHGAQASQARREAMEAVTRRIRIEMLAAQGIAASAEEQRLHNLVRAPVSLYSESDLQGIEAWLLKLHRQMRDEEARRIVASQWIRACIRAAPLGHCMWALYRASPLRAAAGAGGMHDLDLYLLSLLKLEYRSRPFELLRRFGLSA